MVKTVLIFMTWPDYSCQLCAYTVKCMKSRVEKWPFNVKLINLQRSCNQSAKLITPFVSQEKLYVVVLSRPLMPGYLLDLLLFFLQATKETFNFNMSNAPFPDICPCWRVHFICWLEPRLKFSYRICTVGVSSGQILGVLAFRARGLFVEVSYLSFFTGIQST